MKSALPKLLVTAVLLIAWDVLFWDSKPGLNLFLFMLLLMGSIAVFRPDRFRRPNVLAMAIMTVVSGSMVVVYNSPLSIVLTFVFFFTFLGFSLVSDIRLGWYAGLTTAINYIKMPFGIYQRLNEKAVGKKRVGTAFRVVKLGIIPLLVALVFFFIYKGANPKFDALTANMFGWVGEYLEKLLAELFTARAFFILFGLVLITGALFYFKPLEALGWEKNFKEELVPEGNAEERKPKLENNYRMGMTLLVLVNAILLVVNIIDIQWIWFGFEVPEDFSLKSFVHEGTWLLILSIVLSMGVLFVLFHSGQNFFKPNGWLHKLAYMWIAQNLILGASVFLRNYHYISFHGLAYKRIGVIVFLLLVLIGLATMFIKIKRKRTVFHLLRINSWAAAVVLCIMTVVNWDSTIANYNLNHGNSGEIDVDNYLRLSPKVLPLLYTNLHKVERQMEKHATNKVRWIEHTDIFSFTKDLDQRRDRFLEQRLDDDWKSWNWADQKTYNTLLAMGQVPEEFQKP